MTLRLFIITIIIFAIEYYMNPEKAIHDAKIIGIALLIIVPILFITAFIISVFTDKE